MEGYTDMVIDGIRTVTLIVRLPGDLWESIDRMADYAIDQAREDMPDWVMPAEWQSCHLSGDIGNSEVVFRVTRRSNA